MAQSDYLCLTAERANTSISLCPTSDSVKWTGSYSTDGVNWSAETNFISVKLNNIGDKVFLKGTLNENLSNAKWLYFSINGLAGASGNVMSITQEKDFATSTSLLFDYEFESLFAYTSLTTLPELPATELTPYCYFNMFGGCTHLQTLPELPATSLVDYCYTAMFQDCSNIKLSETKTGGYSKEFRIPTSGSATTSSSDCLGGMFGYTGGTFTGTPNINTTYYLYDPKINKIVYDGETLIDLTNDTVTSDTLMEGYTAHDKGGNQIVGTLKGGGSSMPLIKGLGYRYYGSNTSVDLSELDTSNCTIMYDMFKGCAILTSLDLSNFDTSKVTNMSSMFYRCSSLTSLVLSSFNTSKVTDMGDMFYYCSSLTSLDLSNFDTSSVTNMSDMFYYCSKLTSLDLSNFNTSSVTNMNYMFYYCSSLTSLDLSNFDTSSVTNMSNMFSYCSSLTSLDLSSFDFTKVSSYYNMLKNVGNCTIYVKNFTAKEFITNKVVPASSCTVVIKGS